MLFVSNNCFNEYDFIRKMSLEKGPESNKLKLVYAAIYHNSLQL